MGTSSWIRAFAVLGACSAGCGDPATGGASCDPPRGPAVHQFADRTDASGVAFEYSTPDFKGGGLAVADLDADGLPEIVAGRRVGGLALYKNLGGLRFAEATDSGLDPTLQVTSLATADLDADGDLDLLIASPGVVHLLANQGDGTFAPAGDLAGSGMTEHILPVDLDGDGRLDLYLSNYDLRTLNATTNRLYLNRGGFDLAFVTQAGAGQTWTATALDFDGDGDQDLYIANDTLLADFGRPVPSYTMTSAAQPDLFLRNDGPGSDGVPVLTDIAAELGMTTRRSSMGGVLADFDDDGRLDLYVPNYGAKKLFVRDDATGFSERAAALGVEGIGRDNAACGPDTENEKCLLLSWTAAISDFDLDGHDELLVVSGETELGNPPPVLMFARDAGQPYHEVAPDIGCLDARGMIVTDLDGDGDQDVVISQKEAPLKVYENTGHPADGSSLRVQLRGHASNREGIGAIVTAHLASGRSVMHPIGPGGMIHSSGPAEAFFGLGADSVESLDVRWPSGQQTTVSRPAPGSLIVEEGTP